MSREELERMFVANLALIDKILSESARRHALSKEAAEDFAGWVKLKIVESDYAILAKFRGESTLGGYLSVVLSMQYREYRNAQWGRWRPSAAARREGRIGILLETLLARDKLTLDQAARYLRSSGLTTLSDRELAQMASRFPRRWPMRPVETTDAPSDAATPLGADEGIEREERQDDSERLATALREALAVLPADDCLIVRLHIIRELSIADIARMLALAQKSLYRRLKKALNKLRTELEQRGISHDDVRSLLDDLP